MKTILLCSDLDRTLIPNGEQFESPGARELFYRLAARKEIRLAYVSGRDLMLVTKAIGKYGLPWADFVIGDVGTTLYKNKGGKYQLDEQWQQEIGRDWKNDIRGEVKNLLAGVRGMGLRLQESCKQSNYKVSYYTNPDLEIHFVRKAITSLLEKNHIKSTVVWSLDEKRDCGLLDILPKGASKLQAIRFLMSKEKILEKNTVFAGDSGNDLDALTSGLQAILVKNGGADVQKAALEELEIQKRGKCLYIAQGGFLHGMNGNYSSGVMEGLAHFFPETLEWLSDMQ